MPRRLDGIWVDRSKQFYPQPSRLDRLSEKLERAVPKIPKISVRISLRPFASRLGSSTRVAFAVARPASALVIAGFLIFGLMQPAFSQTVTLGRLIKPGNYLVAFLNSDELRPSGGFLGSFAIAHFDGKHVMLDVETNIYKHDNAFLENHFIPLPKPLNEVWPDRSMSLANANYKADFKESAQSILDYYEAEYGSRPDGVIGVTVLPVLDLMGMVGPISLPQDDITLTQDNFLHTLHQNIQVDYFKDPQNRLINEPKTIIADLVAALPKKVTALPRKNLWQLIDGALAKKQLLFYFNDGRQAIAEAHNWAGRLTPTDHEYLALYNGNYGGAKTSLGMDQQSKLEKVGDRERILTITRTHPGGDDQFNSGENRNYMEIFLPKGSKLIDVKRSGTDITNTVDIADDQFSKFGFWFTTQPFSSQVVTINYELPDGLRPGTTVQKQPGTQNEQLLILSGDRVDFSGPLNYDLELP